MVLSLKGDLNDEKYTAIQTNTRSKLAIKALGCLKFVQRQQ